MEAEPDPVVFAVAGRVGAGDQRDVVGGQRRRRPDLPPPRLQQRARTVAQHRPVDRSGDVERVGGLQVRLVEAPEPARSGREERHRVQVGLLVGRIGVPVQSLAVGGVRHRPGDPHRVLLAQPGQRNPTVSPGRRIDGRPVQLDRDELLALEVDEGLRPRCHPLAQGEADHAGGVEGRSGAGQVEGDLGVLDTDGRGALFGLTPGQAERRGAGRIGVTGRHRSTLIGDQASAATQGGGPGGTIQCTSKSTAASTPSAAPPCAREPAQERRRVEGGAAETAGVLRMGAE